MLAGCAVQWPNAQPARDLKRGAEPPGSGDAGVRIYQQRYPGCHASAADGEGGAPHLLPRLQGLGRQRFVGLVLRRYDGKLLSPGQGSVRETRIDEIVERQLGTLRMRAWQEEPDVNAHLMDLFAYLSDRSEDRLGTGRHTVR
ncbi:MAG: hypothetical protein RL227_344 [Pseudomonadota bacterium]